MFTLQTIFITVLALCTAFRRDDVQHLIQTRSFDALAERRQVIGAGQVALLLALHVSTLPYPDPPPDTEPLGPGHGTSTWQQCLLQHRSLGKSIACTLSENSETTCDEDSKLDDHVDLPAAIALSYSGIKSLALYDHRRGLAVYDVDTPRALVVYQRFSELVVYTSPTSFIHFWLDPRHYELVAYVYRPLFRQDAHLFKDYEHLDPKDFTRWMHMADVAEDPIERMLSGAKYRGSLSAMFNSEPKHHLTIGEFRRQLEESASWMLALLYGVGTLIALVCMAWEEVVEWRQLISQRQSDTSLPKPDLAAMIQEVHSRAPKDIQDVCSWWRPTEVSTMPVPNGWTLCPDIYSLSAAAPEVPRNSSHPVFGSAYMAPTLSPRRPDSSRLDPNHERELTAHQGTPAFKALGWRRRVAN